MLKLTAVRPASASRFRLKRFGNHRSEDRGDYPKSSTLTDYTQMELRPLTGVWASAAGGMLLYLVGYLFYRHPILPLLLTPGGLYAPRMLRNYLKKRRRETLKLYFKQTLFSLSSSLSAGRSVENAFREAVDDLRMLDPDGGGDMIAELNIICARMEIGQPVEEALLDFAGRADIEDIGRFADVFAVCKRTGGDLVEIVRRTSNVITEKMDIQQEIAVSVAQKRFEAKALLASPLAMILFMSLTAGDYMDPMYSGAGRVISTAALAALAGCYYWISKIMDIPV